MRNRIKCMKCGDIIESTHTHDWNQCSCQSCYVDGGTAYQRIGGDLQYIRKVLDDDTLVEFNYEKHEK